MMQKFKYIWVVILLIMLIAPADAAFRLYGTVTQAGGGAVNGGLVEIIRFTGSSTAPLGTGGSTSPYIVNGSSALSDGSTWMTRTDASGNIAATGWLVGATGPDTVIVRAWSGRANQTDPITTSTYYGYSMSGSTKDFFGLGLPMAGVPNLTKNISTIYKADAPNAPLACGIRVWYDVSFIPRVDVTCNHNLSPYDAEVVRTVAGNDGAPYVFTVSGGGLTTPRPYYSDAATMTISDLPVGSYTVSAQERNWFNISAAGTAIPFELRASAAGGGAVSKTWTLNKTTTGINTLSIPFDPATAKSLDGAVETSRDITTVEKLINEIVRQTGGTPAVKVFGWYDSATQTHKGLTSISYTGSTVNRSATTFTGGALIADILDATVTMDTPYQASVDRGPLTFSLKGTR